MASAFLPPSFLKHVNEHDASGVGFESPAAFNTVSPNLSLYKLIAKNKNQRKKKVSKLNRKESQEMIREVHDENKKNETENVGKSIGPTKERVNNIK